MYKRSSLLNQVSSHQEHQSANIFTTAKKARNIKRRSISLILESLINRIYIQENLVYLPFILRWLVQPALIYSLAAGFLYIYPHHVQANIRGLLIHESQPRIQ